MTLIQTKKLTLFLKVFRSLTTNCIYIFFYYNLISSVTFKQIKNYFNHIIIILTHLLILSSIKISHYIIQH